MQRRGTAAILADRPHHRRFEPAPGHDSTHWLCRDFSPIAGCVNRPPERTLLDINRLNTGRFDKTRSVTERKPMKQLIAVVLAAMFAAVSFQAVAQDKKPADAKPTAEQCKKDLKLKGCETAAPAKK